MCRESLAMYMMYVCTKNLHDCDRCAADTVLQCYRWITQFGMSA